MRRNGIERRSMYQFSLMFCWHYLYQRNMWCFVERSDHRNRSWFSCFTCHNPRSYHVQEEKQRWRRGLQLSQMRSSCLTTASRSIRNWMKIARSAILFLFSFDGAWTNAIKTDKKIVKMHEKSKIVEWNFSNLSCVIIVFCLNLSIW